MSDRVGSGPLPEELLVVIAAAIAACQAGDVRPDKPTVSSTTRQDAELYAQMARIALMSKRRRGGRV